MPERTCSTGGCSGLAYARDLCKSCYGKAYRAGELSPLPDGQPPRLKWHSLANVNLQAMTADCAICGTGAPIRLRKASGTGKPRAVCRTHLNDRKRGHEASCGDLQSSRRERPKDWPPARNAVDERLRYKYQITLDDYDGMYAEQSGRCKICQREQQRLSVDHCHATGRVRGLLCHRCNVALGWLDDDIATIERAAAYLAAAA